MYCAAKIHTFSVKTNNATFLLHHSSKFRVLPNMPCLNTQTPNKTTYFLLNF